MENPQEIIVDSEQRFFLPNLPISFGSGSPDTTKNSYTNIRLKGAVLWIRIQEGNNDPQK
jgi:hypothetical protein